MTNEKEFDQERTYPCYTCRHVRVLGDKDPCKSCADDSKGNWEHMISQDEAYELFRIGQATIQLIDLWLQKGNTEGIAMTTLHEKLKAAVEPVEKQM
jgi:hypothetical protein